MEFLNNIDNFINIVINSLGIYGPILGCFLICIESMIPILPLCVFITLNFISFGSLLGFIISWVCTVFGCVLSFFLFRKFFKRIFENKVRVKEKANKMMAIVDKLKFDQLVVLIAIPFTPAFLINIACGLSKMKFKKYFMAILIGKIFMVYFWGFVGLTFMESLKNPAAFLKLAIIVLSAYIISMVINRIFHIDKELL